VAAYAAPLHRARWGTPLSALSAVFPDQPAVDERRYVEAVAQELGVELHTMRPGARPTDDLVEWTRLFDGPVPVVAFPQVHEFLTAARALGFRNVLSGELEEFVFEMRRGLLPYLVSRGRVVAALRHARARMGRGDRAGAVARGAAAGLVPGRARSFLSGGKSSAPENLPAWIDPGEVARYGGDAERRTWRSDQLVAFGKASVSLAADSTIQEVAGVRERRPFADVDLWEFALGLSAEAKHGEPGPKALLRRVLRGTVPDVVLDRRDKTVFDRHVLAGIDYPALRTWLVDPPGDRMPGVDYRLLAERLDGERLTLREFVWAKDLAGVHAFLSAWEDSPAC
jgi:asparagine synthetase B (glutamine-hydrolysing)